MPKLLENTPSSDQNMPVIPVADHLRAYVFHGVDLSERGSHAVGTCPFCGKDGKFSIEVATGLWRCFVCGSGTDAGGGNLMTFLRLLWERSDAATNGVGTELASRRGLLDPITLTRWGVCKSIIDGAWLIPGRSPDGRLIQLYRWVPTAKGNVLFPVPGLHHGLHGTDLMDKDKTEIHVAEGWGDGCALWEIMRLAKHAESGGLELTGNEAKSLLGDASVIACPGSNVFREEWLPMFAGKVVTFWYDNDPPRENAGKTFHAGLDGMKRNVKMLTNCSKPPKEIRFLRWGDEEYAPEMPKDVRDFLNQDDTTVGRIALLRQLLDGVEPVPDEWLPNGNKPRSGGNVGRMDSEIRPVSCDSLHAVEDAWAEAAEMRQCLSDVLATCLAVTSSTSQSGDQLFIQMIGDPGSNKTKFCDALLVSDKCFALEHMTGFHSGWKGENGEDCSLIARINHKTLITPEGDVMMSSPKFEEIMSQQRRIFDGTSGAIYKNTTEDRRYTGLRTPWIIAGTPALMDKDQSRMGDRFLRIVIDDPTAEQRRRILRHVSDAAFRAVLQTSNGAQTSTVEGRMLKAYQLTGGYVDWLRLNAEEQIGKVVAATDKEEMGLQCADLAEFAADMRARPDPDRRKQEDNSNKEMPTRLNHQFVRMACCLAVAKNAKKIDAEVMRVVRKISFDTARGRTLDLVRWLSATNPRTDRPYNDPGIEVGRLAQWTGHVDDAKWTTYLTFLRKIGVVDYVASSQSLGLWRLTERVSNLYEQIMEN